MPRKITPEEYRNIFKERFPNYELLSDYNGDKEYITVKCKIDGNIWNTKPNWLKQGAGCQICYNNRRGQTTKKSKDEFIKQAKEIHGDKYDYSKVDYKNNHTKVCIICPEHGEFWQTPNKHFSLKQGCPKCADKRNGFKKRNTLEKFIEKSTEIHNGKYDYSKVKYEGWTVPVTIICPKHGEFKQIAGVHMSGHGCPLCNQSRLEHKVKSFLEKNNIVFIEQYREKWLSKQSLDFYLPDYNIAIECQGLQHFSRDTRWESFNFDVIYERDVRKYNLCKENGIEIIYFSNDYKIINSTPLYNENNTVCNLADLLQLIKNKNSTTLFENIVKEVLNS